MRKPHFELFYFIEVGTTDGIETFTLTSKPGHVGKFFCFQSVTCMLKEIKVYCEGK